MNDSQNYLQEELYSLIQSDGKIFDFLQESSLDGLWYWDIENPDNEWMNDRFWEVLGYDPKEKKHFSSEWQGIINQDDLAMAMDNFESHCKNPNHPYDQIVRYTHRDGSIVWIRCRGMAIRDDSGKPIRMIGAHNDITKLKELELKFQRIIREIDKSYATTKLAFEESERLFETIPNAVFKVDVEGNILKVNSAATSILIFTKDELESMTLRDLSVPEGDDLGGVVKEYTENPDNELSLSKNGLNVFSKDKRCLLVDVTMRMLDTAYGVNIIIVMRDVSEREHLICSLQEKLSENKKLEKLTLIDELTKIYNSRHFHQVLKREFMDSKRYDRSLILLLLDIDLFKNINDNYGHEAGNVVLVELSRRINEYIRYGDTFSRIGGEEFAIVLPCTDVESALVIAERIVMEIENNAFSIGSNQKISVTLSIGMSQLSVDDENCKGIFERADKALYSAKESGRNRVVIL